MTYDDNIKNSIEQNQCDKYLEENIFYKIANKQIFNQILEDRKYFVVISDINPQMPIHLLILPKKKYLNYSSFLENALDEEKHELNLLILLFGSKFNNSYRIMINNGDLQEVKYLHIHFLSN